MATWNSRGLRGSTLEDLINRTNEKYLESNLALIQKIPTPITPIKIDKEHRHITLAYLTRKVRWTISGCTGHSGLLRCKGICPGYLCPAKHSQASGSVYGSV